MTQLATIVAQYGDELLQCYSLLPSQKRALFAIRHCRTALMGGHVYACSQCHERQYRYHSCRNRHCPQCQQDKGEQWLAQQVDRLLPTRYFLLTFTLPAQLRPTLMRHQRQLYNLLFRTAAAATIELARDPRHLNGQIGMIGVLHTWTRDLRYHPHIHFLVPAGALSPDGVWQPSRPNFLLPVRALSRLFRGKFCAGLRRLGIAELDNVSLYKQEWVVHAKAVGDGVAALKYLAPYIFRVALTNKRLIALKQHKVTFQYRRSDTGTFRHARLPAVAFLRLFLTHILPKGFVKVRYYGLFAPSQRHQLEQARRLLQECSEEGDDVAFASMQFRQQEKLHNPICQRCGDIMPVIGRLIPFGRSPPHDLMPLN